MATIKEYISKSGAHVTVRDDDMDLSPAGRAKVYRELEKCVEKLLRTGHLKLAEFEGLDHTLLRARVVVKDADGK